MVRKLPQEYLDYLESGGLMEGFLSVDPSYFQLWSKSEIDIMNANYEVGEHLPGCIGFGSSGGGELLAFNKDGMIYMIPFVGMSEIDAVLVADSWAKFAADIETR